MGHPRTPGNTRSLHSGDHRSGVVCSGRDDRIEDLNIPTQAKTGLEWATRRLIIVHMALCHCGRAEAVIKAVENGPYLCMDCWEKFKRVSLEEQRQRYSYMNYLQRLMAWQVGLPHTAPDIEIPQPAMTLNTTNNIHVASGSQVGQINAGAIIFLDQAVTGLSKSGHAELASLLQSFTQQVADSQELTLQSQEQVLDMLRAVVEQLGTEKEKRNTSVLRWGMQNIGPLVTAATAIAQHWGKLKAALESFL
jgi:hypothetical protein